MSSLLDALSDGSYDLNHKRDTSGNFSKRLVKLRDEVVNDYYKYNISLNTLISKLAKKESLNDDQIKRIVEEVNNQVYLIEYAKLKNKNDRTVRFEIALFEKVKSGTSKEYDSKSEGNEKIAMEKVASENPQSNFFNGPAYKIGGINIPMGMSKDEYMTKKIAQTVKEKQGGIEKISTELNKKVAILGETLVQAKRLGSNENEIFKLICKSASLNDAEMLFMKEASEERVQIAKRKGVVPESFTLNLDVSFEKTASETFGLGRFSKLNSQTTCNTVIPQILVNDTLRVASIDDITKLASEFKSISNDLGAKYVDYMEAVGKCKEAGVTKEALGFL